jgi:DNA helicase-2/ATP-dependent DNA helicase PcrA
LPRSYRFGQNLADHVKGFGIAPQPLVGAGPPAHLNTGAKSPAIFLFDDASVQSVMAKYGQHLVDCFDQDVLDRGIFTAVAGVHELSENDNIPRAMGHYVPSYDPECGRKEAAPSSFIQYLARARYEMADRGNTEKLVNSTASAVLAASELAAGNHGRIGQRSPHRRVIEMLSGSDALVSYLALLEIILTTQGDITSEIWEGCAFAHVEAVVKHLGGVNALKGDVVEFLSGPQAIDAVDDQPVNVARTDNLFSYPSDTPKVLIRLGSIHSVKGETHTATLVLDTYFHDHHLSELKPWLLGAKSGGSSISKKGKVVSEGVRMLGRLKLHYVAMTRPTHLLCLAMRKDALDAEELDVLIARGWAIIDCCPAINEAGS